MMKADDPADDLVQLSDEGLMTRYRDRGRTEDFEALVHRFERELHRYLVRYLGDSALAEDVFQNTFLQVHLKRDLYEPGRSVRPWLYSIATHQAVDALRKAGRNPTLSLDRRADGRGDTDASALVDMLVSDVPGPLSQLQGEERRAWVRASIDKLPDLLKQTLLLAYFEDLKYREIAEALKIPVGTVKSRLHAALAKLHQMGQASDRDGDD